MGGGATFVFKHNHIVLTLIRAMLNAKFIIFLVQFKHTILKNTYYNYFVHHVLIPTTNYKIIGLLFSIYNIHTIPVYRYIEPPKRFLLSITSLSNFNFNIIYTLYF